MALGKVAWSDCAWRKTMIFWPLVEVTAAADVEYVGDDDAEHRDALDGDYVMEKTAKTIEIVKRRMRRNDALDDDDDDDD